MRAKYVGNKADKIILSVKNGETSATIPRGTPVVLNLSATAAADDGLSVVLPSTAGAAASYAYKYGVALDNYATGQLGESILNGVATYALVGVLTRSATSASWPSSASSAASLVALGLDTANNCFLLGASSAGSLPGAGIAHMIDNVASIAGSASATSDTRTNIALGYRVFVRML